MKINTTTILPIQALVVVILTIQILLLSALLYLQRTFVIDLKTTFWGWIMLGVAAVFCGWNVWELIVRKSRVRKAVDYNQGVQILSASYLTRFITFLIISLTALIICYITNGNMAYLFFFIMSFAFQIMSFPTKTKFDTILAIIPASTNETTEPSTEVVEERTEESL